MKKEIPKKLIEEFDVITYKMYQRPSTKKLWSDEEVIKLQRHAMLMGLKTGYLCTKK